MKSSAPSFISRIATLGATLGLALFISACSMSPGMYIGTPKDAAKSLSDEGAPPGALIPISPQLISQQRAAQSSQIDDEVKSLFGVATVYRIGPGDILNIVIWNHPELALTAASSSIATDTPSQSEVGNGYNVSTEGLIQFPFLGLVKVGGLTENQARAALTNRLAAHLNDPQLTVRIQAYRNGRVYMDGEVHRPGLLNMNDIPMTLPEAINRAGGFTLEADRSSVILTRDGAATRINLPALSRMHVNPGQILLRNGDMIRVVNQDETKVFLLGDVFAPRAQPMHDGELTLAQALGEAGGVNPETGNARQIYVIRKGADDKAEIYHLDAKQPTALVLAADFMLEPHDMVFVDPAPIVRWNRVISMLLPSYGAVTTTRAMTR